MICVQKKSNFNKPSLRAISEESAHVPAGSKAVSGWSGARTSLDKDGLYRRVRDQPTTQRMRSRR